MSASDYRQVQVSASDCRQGKVSVLKTNNSVICAIQLVSSSKKSSGNWLVKTWLAVLDRSLSSPIQGQISALISTAHDNLFHLKSKQFSANRGVLDN